MSAGRFSFTFNLAAAHLKTFTLASSTSLVERRSCQRLANKMHSKMMLVINYGRERRVSLLGEQSGSRK
jgi:hypothetical protein